MIQRRLTSMVRARGSSIYDHGPMLRFTAPDRDSIGRCARRSSLGRLPLATFLSLALHVSKEWPAFPEWATRHSGTTTRALYVLPHLPILAIALGVSIMATGSRPRPAWTWSVVAIQWALAVNGLFHIAATALVLAYAPGSWTGAGLDRPLTAYLLFRVRGDRSWTAIQITTAGIVGTALSALAAASLRLEFDVLAADQLARRTEF